VLLFPLQSATIVELDEQMVQESKKELRRELKLVMANLDPRWIAKAHTEVCHRVVELIRSLPSFNPQPRHVLAWIPCFQGEVDLAEAIGELLKDSIVYLPRVERSGSMRFVRINEDWGAHLEQGPRGIMQPADDYGEPFVAPPTSDIIVVMPGLAFDGLGQRLGRGAGHYDRFLASVGLERAVKIGVCWSMQLVKEVPTDHYDVRMDWICYERGVIRAESGVNEE
jgi:5-formyltetrahydrofolate cyclo-ligase